MQCLPRKVLILGCGTIGQSKAELWLSLGAEVYLHDINPLQLDKLLSTNIGFIRYSHQAVSGLIVDISTPSDQHASSLLWTLETITSLSTLLVEKPICTNSTDKNLIKKLLMKYKSVPIYVNESYYWSSALDWLQNQIAINKEEITSIQISLSKNRVADTRAGRFFDYELETYGIEIPHAIAILQKLGIDIHSLRTETNTLYRSTNISTNQGAHVHLMDNNDRSIVIESFLGDFIIKNGSKAENSLNRWLVVRTNKNNKYHVSFDPLPGEPRYKSAVIVNNAEKVIFEDDHLRKHLEKVMTHTIDTKMKHYLSPKNSLLIYDLLKQLYESRLEELISDEELKVYEVEKGVGVT